MKLDMRRAGAYSDSKGIVAARESVVAYIEERDGFPTNIDDIYLTNGASEGTQLDYTPADRVRALSPVNADFGRGLSSFRRQDDPEHARI